MDMGWEKNSIFKYYINYGIVLLLAISISANEIDNSIKENKKAFEKIALQIWDYAELGYLENKSSNLLANELEKNGFTITEVLL